MTTETKTNVLNELAKAGVLFLVMGIIIYYLYKEVSTNQEEMRLEIKALRIETKECSQAYQDVLLNQIEKNTDVLVRIEQLMTTKRRY